MRLKHVQFRLEDDDYALVESIAQKMGLPVSRAARHLTIAGARVTAGLEKPPTELLSSLHHDVEEFRLSLEAINDSTSDGLAVLKRDVQSIDKLLVALLRGTLQVVTISRMFAHAHNKELYEQAIRSAESSMKSSLQELRSTSTNAKSIPENST